MQRHQHKGNLLRNNSPAHEPVPSVYKSNQTGSGVDVRKWAYDIDLLTLLDFPVLDCGDILRVFVVNFLSTYRLMSSLKAEDSRTPIGRRIFTTNGLLTNMSNDDAPIL